jgi:ribosomal protein S18 acetylase RimI-like enzyme
MTESDLNIRMAINSDRSRLANLIHFGSYIHQHLDWKSPLDWIGRQPYLIMERDGGLLSALACPPELPAITWIRLFAVSTNFTVDRAWKSLWSATVDELSRLGKIQIAALSLQNWFNATLEESNFEHKDDVVVLIWESTATIPTPKFTDIKIRPMHAEDLLTVTELDNSAFDLEWRNSNDSLELAFQQSAIASVAEMGDEIVGYQYTTIGAAGGHLARLAVRPSAQGHGIGYSLVHDVLTQFRKQGVLHVTVNTQNNNTASLALYEKAGFKSTGESYRIYQYIL